MITGEMATVVVLIYHPMLHVIANIIFVILTVFISVAQAQGLPFKPVCVDKNVKNTVIYFHGWIRKPGDRRYDEYIRYEDYNRQVLNRLADECGFNLISPVTEFECRRDRTTLWCWNLKPEGLIDQVTRSVDQQLGACVPHQPENTAIIGFSDGGYLLDALPPPDLQSYRAVYATALEPGNYPKNRKIQYLPHDRKGHMINELAIRVNLRKIGFCQ